ncbi:hypothetical protein GGI43DRAFT_418206 [Trichoderma evansii]
MYISCHRSLKWIIILGLWRCVFSSNASQYQRNNSFRFIKNGFMSSCSESKIESMPRPLASRITLYPNFNHEN